MARVVLDRIPLTLPRRRHVQGRLTKEQRLRRLVEDVLVGLGFDEAYTWSLAADDPDAGAIRLPDPMTADQAVLRTTLLPGLVEAARVQLDTGAESIALFEVARVYLPSGAQLPDERWRVTGIAQGGFLRAKGAVETIAAAAHVELPFERDPEPGTLLHPGKAARTPTGAVGELHPAILDGEWGVFELDLETLAAAAPERVEYEDVITFPALLQDVAVVVAGGRRGGRARGRGWGGRRPRNSARCMSSTSTAASRSARGGSRWRSRLAFQSPERTLSDEDAAKLRERIVAALAERFGAELRA